MREKILEAYDVDKGMDNLTYKNLLVIIVSMVGFAFIGGMFLALAFGIYGEGVIRDNVETYYLFLFNVAFLTIVTVIYKPVIHFIKDIWDVSVLRSWETYLYILIGFIVSYLIQHFMFDVFSFEGGEEQLENISPQNSLIQSVIYIISTDILTPVREEIWYRGILYRFLEKKYNFLVGIIGSAFIFGIFHVGYPITAMMMGIVFAMLYKKTQSIVPGIILHMIWNGYVSISWILSP
ncbi:type II CAAX endopeptidase family protein [Bacillus anthracis]|uniref:CPBP family intramembrane glutamic endopeptidase n=1 Tax=Bacillus anthracis TaxID=1392 RepID=UPI003D1F0A7F